MLTPPKYILSHVCFGTLASLLSKKLQKIVIILFLCYQIWQFLINKRYFPLEFRFEEGNTIEHTLNKIGQFCLGYCIGLVYIKLRSKHGNLSTRGIV